MEKRGGNPGDLVVCPAAATSQSGRWPAFIRGTERILGLEGLTKMAIGGARIRWSWDGNLSRNTPVTRTGIRTPPSMWINDLNKKPSSVELNGMVRSVENGRWFTGRMTLVGDGRQDMNLQRFFGRMNWHSSQEALSRKDWPGRYLTSPPAWRIAKRVCLRSRSLRGRVGGKESSTLRRKYFAGLGAGVGILSHGTETP